MADSKIAYPITYETNILTCNGLIIQRQSVSAEVSTWKSVTFLKEFPNLCLQVIPLCGQAGFAAPNVITVKDVTKTGCSVVQSNTANASMVILVVAIGY